MVWRFLGPWLEEGAVRGFQKVAAASMTALPLPELAGSSLEPFRGAVLPHGAAALCVPEGSGPSPGGAARG